MKPTSASLALLLMACWPELSQAQTSPARGQAEQPVPASEEQRLADYLALLHQIAPAAEAAARTYLAAMRLKCGLSLDTSALRQAMAREGGDPILMGLIRAASTHDSMQRHRLVAQLDCQARGKP
jgi:acetyl-CoA acetyltransferase